MTIFIQSIISGVTTGLIYALIAYSYNLVFSVSKVLNFAQGELVMLGAVILAWLVSLLYFPLLGGIIIVLILIGMLAYFNEKIAVDRFLGRHGAIGWIASTFGLSIVFREGATIIWGSEPLPFPSLLSSSIYRVGNAIINGQQILIILFALVLMLSLEYLYTKTKFGMATKAVSFRQDTSTLMGINVKKIIITNFILAGFLSAIAGILVAPVHYASISMGLDFGLKAFVAAIIGTIGSTRGAVAGGLILGLSQSFTIMYLSPRWSDVVVFLLFIFILAIKPGGLFGKPQDRYVLQN